MKRLSSLNPLESSKKALVFVAVCFMGTALYFGNWKSNKIIAHDVVIYYQYLTAGFMFQDMSFDFAYKLPEDFDGEIWLNKTNDGERAVKMTMGTAVMMTPFYLMAAAVNKLFGLGSYGYSSLFQFFILIGGLIYCMFGLLLQRKILRRFFDDRVVALVLILMALATNLAFYTCSSPGMSHVYSFFLFSWFLLTTITWHESPTLSKSIQLGLALGLITLVRPPNGVVALIPVFYGCFGAVQLKEKWKLISKNYHLGMVSIVVSIAIVSLQCFFWKQLSGDWISYGYGKEGFFWNDPKIFEVLFSFRKGFLIYAPVLIFALAGIFVRNKTISKLKGALLIFLFVNIYIVSSWWCWWYGGGFGMRALMETVAFLSIFLAAFIDLILNKLGRIVQFGGVALAILFIALNYTQMIQYNKGILHYDGMTAGAYKNIFLKFHYPPDYSEYISSPNYEEALKGKR